MMKHLKGLPRFVCMKQLRFVGQLIDHRFICSKLKSNYAYSFVCDFGFPNLIVVLLTKNKHDCVLLLDTDIYWFVNVIAEF